MCGVALAVATSCATASTRATTPVAHSPTGSAQPLRLAAASQWRIRLFDDFRHGLAAARWIRYSGEPQGDPGGWWNPSHAIVRNGILSLETYRDPRLGGRWVSGGVSSAPGVKQLYGRYEVRFRMDPGYGVGGALLLWPAGRSGPPEVDIWKDGGADATRTSMFAAAYRGRDNRQMHQTLLSGFAAWHTAGVEWTPGALVFTLDGRPWTRLVGRSVPAVPLALDIQAQAGACANTSAPCPDATTPARVNLQVAWVRIYAYRPARR